MHGEGEVMLAERRRRCKLRSEKKKKKKKYQPESTARKRSSDSNKVRLRESKHLQIGKSAVMTYIFTTQM
jgi:hypothetical protein